MPLWDIHSSTQLFSAEEKQDLAKSITTIYTAAGLPAFYVRVRFTDHSPSSTFSGGEQDDKFIHFQIWHIARVFTSDEHKKGFLAKVDEILNPAMQGKGADWEYTVNESPRDLWKINGMVPPPAGSEMEKQWAKVNRPIGE